MYLFGKFSTYFTCSTSTKIRFDHHYKSFLGFSRVAAYTKTTLTTFWCKPSQQAWTHSVQQSFSTVTPGSFRGVKSWGHATLASSITYCSYETCFRHEVGLRFLVKGINHKHMWHFQVQSLEELFRFMFLQLWPDELMGSCVINNLQLLLLPWMGRELS